MSVDAVLESTSQEQTATPGSTSRPADGTNADFRRELTPAWLSTVCLLAGQRPPDLTRPFRYVHLGCGSGVTAAVVAAAHPDAEVWAWDGHASGVEATRRLRDAEGLDNLTVYERPGFPTDLGGELADIVVVQDVMVHASDELRELIVEAIGANLRPGGLVCVTYKTTVGWIEIAPVVGLMRYVAQRYTDDPAGLVDHVLDLLATLRAGGARHLTERPAVAAWLDELAVTDHAHIFADYLRDRFEPMSHAQMSDALSAAGCSFVGSARLTDELGLDVPPPLNNLVSAAATRTLRETYRDLAVRRTYRLDVFRLGLAQLRAEEQQSTLRTLDSSLPAGSGCDSDDAATRIRKVLGSGLMFPAVPGCRPIDDGILDGIGGE